MNEATKQTRDPGIDLVKTAAIIGVVILHTCSYGYESPVLSFQWTASVVWGCFVFASVPLFFMCSGALLLPPQKHLPIRRLYARNILRIVIAMLAWAVFYKIFHLLGNGGFSAAALWQAIKEVLLLNQEFHMYYLHIILLVYAFLPLTRALVRSATETELRYALILWFLLGILYPTVLPYRPFSLLVGIPLQWMMNMSYASIGYGLLGWYLTQRLPSPRRAALFAAAGFLLMLVPTLFRSVRAGELDTNFLEGMSVGVCCFAVGLFSLLYGLGQRLRGAKLEGAVTRFSRASFCIFLVHVVWLNVFRRLGLTAGSYPALIAIPVFAAANLLLSYLCWFMLSRIPLVRRWLI